jgi:DNA (cytosine-5)-methyltransferase 1
MLSGRQIGTMSMVSASRPVEHRSPWPTLLDLFCGAGGASVGYYRAGFTVVGVDHRPQPNYPFPFIQADAIQYAVDHGHEFDAIHASPPCQDHSSIRTFNPVRGTAWLLAATRDALISARRPYVIENVAGAPMIAPLRLCGSEFGLQAEDIDGRLLRLERHRLFESNLFLYGAGGCVHDRHIPVAGVYGGNDGLKERSRPGHRGYRPQVSVRRLLMGIDWMTRDELSQAIPPAYTEFIGAQLLTEIGVRS